MKFKNLIVVLSSALMFGSCDPADLTITFNLPTSDIHFTVPATPVAGSITIPTKAVVFNLDSVLNANGVNKDQIQSILLKSFIIDIDQANPDANFDNFDWISKSMSTPNISKVLIAEKNPIPHDKIRSISLDVKGVEMANMFKEGNITLYVGASSNSAITSDIPMTAKMVFTVKGKIIK
jgi:hypothetical protein